MDQPGEEKDAKRNKSNGMLLFAVIAGVLTFLGLRGGSPVGIFFALLTIGLLVGALVIRP